MGALSGLGEAAGKLLKARGETIAVAESSAGGLISAALLAVPGASAYFVGGGVIYTHKAREILTEIDFEKHPGMRSASEPYAALLAETMRRRLDTTWGLAETGASGPGGNRYGDAAGHSCIAIVGPKIERAAEPEPIRASSERVRSSQSTPSASAEATVSAAKPEAEDARPAAVGKLLAVSTRANPRTPARWRSTSRKAEMRGVRSGAGVPSRTSSSAANAGSKRTVVSVYRASSVSEMEPTSGRFSARSRLPQYLISAKFAPARADAVRDASRSIGDPDMGLTGDGR